METKWGNLIGQNVLELPKLESKHMFANSATDSLVIQMRGTSAVWIFQKNKMTYVAAWYLMSP